MPGSASLFCSFHLAVIPIGRSAMHTLTQGPSQNHCLAQSKRNATIHTLLGSHDLQGEGAHALQQGMSAIGIVHAIL